MGIFRTWKKTYIVLIGHLEAELLLCCEKITFLTNCSLRQMDFCQENSWHPLMLYLDHGNKETLNWLDV